MRRREFISVVSAMGMSGLARSVFGNTPQEASPGVDVAAGRTAEITDLRVVRVRKKNTHDGQKQYVELTTDAGITGLGGDLYLGQGTRLAELAGRLREVLVGRDPGAAELSSLWLWNRLYPGQPLAAYADGRDPLSGASIWNTRRQGRHTATGSIMMALSAVDNALWDVRGKLAELPVYRLLGGARDQLPCYMSLMPSKTLEESGRRAREMFDQGFTAQKWFLTHGPPDGEEGFRQNVGLVETLRHELGADARLMFDFAVGCRGRCDWDVPYAIRLAKAIEPFHPFWLEEPFSPEEIDAYAQLHDATNIPLATGEHTYSHWNIRPFLDRGLVRVVQSDPEWCGGISELRRICELARKYEGIRVIPHGHQVPAAAHVVASHDETLCPLVEYGIGWMPGHQQAYRQPVAPIAGKLQMPQIPGLGFDLDWDRYERV